jgi:hypothetical protein
MRKVAVFSALLITGLVSANLISELAGVRFRIVEEFVNFLTLTGLGLIRIHVGYKFGLDKSDIRAHGWDYVVATTASAFPG